MSQTNNTEKKGGADWGTIIAVIVVVAFFVIGYLSCNSEPSTDVVHDPNGFMGYSDDFWDWLGDQ